MQVAIEAVSGAKASTVVVDRPVFVIGRAAECDLRLESPLISRHHCVLTVQGDDVFIRDLRSSNGTGINDRLLAGEQLLHDRDVVWVATTPIQVRIRRRRAATERMVHLANRVLGPSGITGFVSQSD